ncbi:MAG: retron St85 family RNA-directed DNA polymerase [Nitrosomonas sp.]|nr:retron St85 family RNA-directed DNA polymerase [Nitrosomonas sp.]
MNWIDYQKEFTAKSISAGYKKDYIERCLTYAHRLYERNLPIIYSLDHFASLVGYEKSYLNYIAYRQNPFYRNFEIPKKSSGKREISEPLPNLKKIQRWVLDNILYRVSPSQYAKAFVPGRSIKANARFHRNQKMVLTLDINNFFPRLSSKLVKQFFTKCGYSKKVTYYLTRLCVLNGGLPQGAPTSPALANLMLKDFDLNIAKYCKSKTIRYTRYADDLTFSGVFAENELIKQVKKELKKIDLELKNSKTRLMLKHQRQEVTGIVVNNKLQAPREFRRNLRQAIFYIEKYGLENHLAKLNEFRANYVSHLLGQANFVLFINPRDQDALKALEILKDCRSSNFMITSDD